MLMQLGCCSSSALSQGATAAHAYVVNMLCYMRLREFCEGLQGGKLCRAGSRRTASRE